MANTLYPTAKKKFLDGNINLLSDTIKVSLVDLNDYTYSSSHEFYSTLSATGGVVATATLSGKATTDGQFTANNVTFTAVTGDQSEAVIIWKDTGTASTSPLIAFIDTFESGMPVTPNGGDIQLNWDTSPAYIFAI